MSDKLHFQHYKGIYYAFKKGKGLFKSDEWILSSHPNGEGHKVAYNANRHRIDQCIDLFKQSLSDMNKVVNAFKKSIDPFYPGFRDPEKILKLPTKAQPSKKLKDKRKKDGKGKR